MPINLSYEEFFKRAQPERKGEADAPSPEKEDEEVIAPDNYLYDEDTFEMVEHEKPEDGEFFDAPLSVQGADRRRAFGLADFGFGDLFSDTTDAVHPDVQEHVNEYLKRGEQLTKEEKDIIDEHSEEYRKKELYREFIRSHKQEPSKEGIPDAQDRPEEIFKNRYNLAIDKTKITELLIDSYFVYENEGEPEHNSTTIDHPETDANVEIYHKEGYDVVAFRGTESTQDILTDINTFSTRLSAYFPFITPENDLTAHSGFVKGVASVYEEVKKNIRNPTYDATGHSLGSASIQIFAYVYLQDTGIRPRHLISFGSPRVFIETAETPTSRYNLALDHLRVMNTNDMVTYMPSGDSSLMGLTKFATEGAMTGAQFGAYAGGTGGTIGAAVGSAVGGLVGALASGGFKHVGVGLLLAPVKNAVVNIEGKQQILKDKNYYILPEDVDLARNPIEFDSTFATKVVGGGLYSAANNYITNSIKDGTGFLGINPPNVFREFKRVFDIQFLDNLDGDVLDIMARRRGAENKVARPFMGLNYDGATGDLRRRAEQYLTGRFLANFEADTTEIRKLKVAMRERFRQEQGMPALEGMEKFGFGVPTPAEEQILRPLYERVFLRAMNSQRYSDLQDARVLYGYIGAQLVGKMVIDGSAVANTLNHVQGHLFAQYFHNVGLLPNVIFEGARTYNTNEGVKYLGYAKNQFVEYPQIESHILGFIFYPAEEEFKYSNKIMVY